MGRSKFNRRQHSSGHNNRNNENTSKVRASKRPELQRQTGKEKSPRNKDREEEESSGNDRVHQENEHSNRNELKDGAIDKEESRKIDGASAERFEKNKEACGQVNNNITFAPLTDDEKIKY